jgi:hypothetical protein
MIDPTSVFVFSFIRNIVQKVKLPTEKKIVSFLSAGNSIINRYQKVYC